jgi:serine/threonine protein kinase
VALVWAFATVRWRPKPAAVSQPESISHPAGEPETPDYERFGPPFGEGGFGKVWVVRNAIGQWQALKEVYKDRFHEDSSRFDMELNGIQNYKPVSHKHPGLLRIEFVSREKRGGYFYYVMELGDALDPDWQRNPTLYKPLDLTSKRERAPRKRLPIRECTEIGIRLAEALGFLHREGLTHRDIKPANVLFVNGHPKLADAGTVTVLRPREKIQTRVMSRGFTPTDEPPGTRQADIFSLGKLLYVISTGRDPQDDFPALSTTLVDNSDDFMGLNKVIVKACHPDLRVRYGEAEELRQELLGVLSAMK